MSLQQIFHEYLGYEGWSNDEVLIDEETQVCTITTTLNASNQSYELFIKGDPGKQRIALYIYPPFRVNEGKLLDAAQLCNYYNEEFMYAGRVSVDDDGILSYRQILDIEDIEPTLHNIKNMLVAGMSLLTRHLDELAAISLTKKSYESIMDEVKQKKERRTG